MAQSTTVFETDWYTVEIINQDGTLEAYMVPQPRLGRLLCPVCIERLDFDAINGVGPKGTPYEGMVVHRYCEMRLLQAVRNYELELERKAGKK